MLKRQIDHKKECDIMTEVTYTNHISVEDYNALRDSVEWIAVTPKRAMIALKNSFYICVAVCDGKPVGMVRIVSDGGYTYFITDVIVNPAISGATYRLRINIENIRLHSKRCDGRRNGYG